MTEPALPQPRLLLGALLAPILAALAISLLRLAWRVPGYYEGIQNTPGLSVSSFLSVLALGFLFGVAIQCVIVGAATLVLGVPGHLLLVRENMQRPVPYAVMGCIAGVVLTAIATGIFGLIFGGTGGFLTTAITYGLAGALTGFLFYRIAYGPLRRAQREVPETFS